MDAWWDNMIDALLPQLVAVEDIGVMVSGRNDPPGPTGSAFQGGYYGYMRRVLDMALDQTAAPYKQLECAGSGVLADCRAALITSLRPTIAQLGIDTAQWDPTLEQNDAIRFTSFDLAEPPDIH